MWAGGILSGMRLRGSGARPNYSVLIEPDGPYYLAGDSVSNVNAWMEGAALSAKLVVQKISDKVKSARLASSSDGTFAG